jgi:fructose-1,6-bisphosphatase/inositol monophosphatase family enzyme
MGFPAFTTSIALFVNDLLTLGWVYDPNRDEVFCGQRGGGAWADGGSGIRSLRVRDVTQLSQAVVAAFRPRNAEEMDFHQQLLSRSWKFRSLSCSSLEICYIASGIYDAFVDLRKQGSERDCDIAAAALVLREAGGEVFDGHGGPHWIARPGMSSILVRRNLLATASSELAREILEIASSHHPTIPDIGGAS